MKIRHKMLLPIGIISALMLLSCKSYSKQLNENNYIRVPAPDIAKLGNVVVGWDTILNVTKHLGQGVIITGAHPKSAHFWKIDDTKDIFYVDGFDYYKDASGFHQVIQEARLERNNLFFLQNTSTMTNNHYNFSYGFWDFISLGMKRNIVALKLKQKGLPYKIDQSKNLIVTFQKQIPGMDQKRTWMVTLSFRNSTLDELAITSD